MFPSFALRVSVALHHRTKFFVFFGDQSTCHSFTIFHESNGIVTIIIHLSACGSPLPLHTSASSIRHCSLPLYTCYTLQLKGLKGVKSNCKLMYTKNTSPDLKKLKALKPKILI